MGLRQLLTNLGSGYQNTAEQTDQITDPDEDEADVRVEHITFDEESAAFPPDPPEPEIVPVCDGYSLRGAEAVEHMKSVNDNWWEDEGSFKLAAALESTDSITKKELADIVELTPSTVGNHLRGERSPGVGAIEGYERVFGDGLFEEPRYDIRFRGVAEDR